MRLNEFTLPLTFSALAQIQNTCMGARVETSARTIAAQTLDSTVLYLKDISNLYS